MTRKAAAGAETGALEGNAPGRESGPKVVMGERDHDRVLKSAEVALTLAPEETAGIGPEAGRGGGLGRGGIGREGEAGAGEGGIAVEVGIEREIDLRVAFLGSTGHS